MGGEGKIGDGDHYVSGDEGLEPRKERMDVCSFLKDRLVVVIIVAAGFIPNLDRWYLIVGADWCSRFLFDSDHSYQYLIFFSHYLLYVLFPFSITGNSLSEKKKGALS